MSGGKMEQREIKADKTGNKHNENENKKEHNCYSVMMLWSWFTLPI